MTERGDKVRVSLYGCTHKPKVSAMVSPKKGDDYYCPTCRRKRLVVGVVTTWSGATLACQNCVFGFTNDGSRGKKRMVSIALRHANSRLHKVNLIHDGEVDVIRGEGSAQIPLIDDLLL
jgi:ribosomal protein L37AE/L43A